MVLDNVRVWLRISKVSDAVPYYFLNCYTPYFFMPSHTLVVRVALQDDAGKFLFLQRPQGGKWGNYWTLPGGKPNYGESLIAACKREGKEETDLTIDVPRLINYNEILPQQAGDDHFVTLYFAASWSGTIKINKESQAYRWVGLDEFDSLAVAFNRSLIRSVLATVARP